MTGPMNENQAPPNSDASQAPEDTPSDWLPIGRVAAPRGLHGEMRIVLVDPDAREFLRAGELYMGEDHLCLRVRQARLFKGQGLLELEGIDDRDAAEFWRDARIYVPAVSVAPLDEGEYYYRQIVGLSVITEQGETLGHVTEILPTGANDVYVVQGANGEILLPAIKEVIREIDLHTGTVLVRLLDGLRD